MSDFDFLPEDRVIRSRRTPGQQQGGGNRGNPVAQQPRPRIALPSLQDVQDSQRPTAVPTRFTPGAVLAGVASAQTLRQAPATSQWPSAPPPPTQPAPPPQSAMQAAATPALGLGLTMPRYHQPMTGAPAGPPPLGVVPLTPAVAAPSSSGAAALPATRTPAPAPVPSAAAAPNLVQVSQRQQGNPVLRHLRGVRWAFADIVPDYLCGSSTAVLFLSLRYHLLQPEYVLHRLAAVQRAYRLMVLLLLVDAEEVVKPLQELHRAALGSDATLICAWSNEECARYIELLKAYENKPAAAIMERPGTDYMGRLCAALSSVRGVTRPDAAALTGRFGSLAQVMCASPQQLSTVPGLGPVKARRLAEAFEQPFRRTLGSAASAAVAAGGAPAAAAGASRDAARHVPPPVAVSEDSEGSGSGWDDDDALDSTFNEGSDGTAGQAGLSNVGVVPPGGHASAAGRSVMLPADELDAAMQQEHDDLDLDDESLLLLTEQF